MTSPFTVRLAAVGGALMLSACAGQLDHFGKPPSMTPVQSPMQARDYRPVTMPMPEQPVGRAGPASLWRAGSQSFFKDNRAAKVGDILTVVIDINDKAQIQNQTARSREGSESLGIPNLLGLESKLGSLLPGAVDPANLASVGASSESGGQGNSRRSETVEMKVAAVVTEVLPNGNLVVRGSQEVRVNFELRELLVVGVVRPQDISSANSVSYEKIAEARISYGGRGQIMDLQQPRYGQQIFDHVLPW